MSSTGAGDINDPGDPGQNADAGFDFDAHFDPQVDPRLLEVLICPLTHGPLEYDRERQELISRKAGLAYPIRDGAPIMLPEEARALEG